MFEPSYEDFDQNPNDVIQQLVTIHRIPWTKNLWSINNRIITDLIGVAVGNCKKAGITSEQCFDEYLPMCLDHVDGYLSRHSEFEDRRWDNDTESFAPTFLENIDDYWAFQSNRELLEHGYEYVYLQREYDYHVEGFVNVVADKFIDGSRFQEVIISEYLRSEIQTRIFGLDLAADADMILARLSPQNRMFRASKKRETRATAESFFTKLILGLVRLMPFAGAIVLHLMGEEQLAILLVVAYGFWWIGTSVRVLADYRNEESDRELQTLESFYQLLNLYQQVGCCIVTPKVLSQKLKALEAQGESFNSGIYILLDRLIERGNLVIQTPNRHSFSRHFFEA